VGEFIYRRDAMVALKASIGILVGSLVGVLVHLLLAIATVAVFLYSTLPGLVGT
jgi:hypothetical protein